MFFKKESNVKKNQSKKNGTLDFEKAKLEFLDQYNEIVKTANTWKGISFICLILTLISILGVVYLSTRSSLIPYVIEVDETGNAKGINPAYQINYEPNEANIKFYLRSFVNQSRWVSNDQVLQGSFYTKSVAFLTQETLEKFNDLVQKENWTEMIKNGLTRDVQIESINKVAGTDTSYQVRWLETVYSKGSVLSTRRMQGIFSLKIEAPKNLEDLELNPLGIKIQDYHITSEK